MSTRIDSTHPRNALLSDLPVTEGRRRLAGISTPILEGGDGAPVVLLHGPGEHAAKWLRVIPDLATTHRVIAPDLPGHGESEIPDGPIAAEQVLDWLGELIDATCATPPALVGQILGGAIAARFAIARGGRIRSLVLADSLGLAPFQPAPEFGQALMGFLAQPDAENHDELWRRCAFDLDALRTQMGQSWEDLKSYNLDRARVPGCAAPQQRLMEQFGLPQIPPADLERITVPTTLIWGRHDLATPLSVAEAASARHGWHLEVIDDAADDPAIEQPGAFVSALRGAVDARQRSGEN